MERRSGGAIAGSRFGLSLILMVGSCMYRNGGKRIAEVGIREREKETLKEVGECGGRFYLSSIFFIFLFL